MGVIAAAVPITINVVSVLSDGTVQFQADNGTQKTGATSKCAIAHVHAYTCAAPLLDAPIVQGIDAAGKPVLGLTPRALMAKYYADQATLPPAPVAIPLPMKQIMVPQNVPDTVIP